MKDNIKSLLNGFFIGIGKIMPGVSGSLIALNLGIYDKLINIVNHPFKNLKENIKYLFPILLGIFFSIIMGSKILSILLNYYYAQMIFLFLGFLIGSISIKKYHLNSKNYFFILIMTIIFIYLLNIKTYKLYTFNNNIYDYIYIFFIGLIDSATMVIPGISSTAIFISMGCYKFVLSIFSDPFDNILITIILGFGLLTGIVVTSKIVGYLLNKNSKVFIITIHVFIYSSLYFLFKQGILNSYNIKEIILNISMLLIGYIISNKFKNKI